MWTSSSGGRHDTCASGPIDAHRGLDGPAVLTSEPSWPKPPRSHPVSMLIKPLVRVMRTFIFIPCFSAQAYPDLNLLSG